MDSLQDAIRAKELPTFRALTRTSTYQFYEVDPGTNYAQARYLCYYLQERDLLTDFYDRFRKNSAEDPTGYETLTALLDTRDMDAFQADWEAWVLDLTYP